ncbi:hypothetical protein CYMTET_30953 [Cymbomonas tetramitiformis]|uniref:Uncharacterized protein n=1 Tax=Cymbomonas tetramitiformis TaxID=36881 RepID=A0AAE0KTP0_9CHLO|nr:hypothetical protein CYMTET_30953 [Cymbomonas tetramitiformis]
MSSGVEKKCDAVAPALDRCVRFFEAADVQSAVEMLGFGLALGGFMPAVRDARGKSASEYRTSDKRAREDNDKNEEEQADGAVFEEGEEVATVPQVNKKGKEAAGAGHAGIAGTGMWER